MSVSYHGCDGEEISVDEAQAAILERALSLPPGEIGHGKHGEYFAAPDAR